MGFLIGGEMRINVFILFIGAARVARVFPCAALSRFSFNALGALRWTEKATSFSELSLVRWEGKVVGSYALCKLPMLLELGTFMSSTYGIWYGNLELLSFWQTDRSSSIRAPLPPLPGSLNMRD